MNARFWSSKEAMAFSEFLDSVEAGLRSKTTVAVETTGLRDSVSRR
jgi:hypothetical protein